MVVVERRQGYYNSETLILCNPSYEELIDYLERGYDIACDYEGGAVPYCHLYKEQYENGLSYNGKKMVYVNDKWMILDSKQKKRCDVKQIQVGNYLHVLCTNITQTNKHVGVSDTTLDNITSMINKDIHITFIVSMFEYMSIPSRSKYFIIKEDNLTFIFMEGTERELKYDGSKWMLDGNKIELIISHKHVIDYDNIDE